MPTRAHATSWAPEAAGIAYERGRPGYPAAVAALLAERLKVDGRSRLVDVAAGTGKLTRLLEELGVAQVVAVEPMAGMRAQLTATCPGTAVVAAGAEGLPFADGSLDAVTVAQAFHWLEVTQASKEFARVLRPGGHLAVITNQPDHTTAWQAELWAVLRRHENLVPRPAAVFEWRAKLGEAGHFTGFERFEFPHRQHFETRDDFDFRFTSISHVLLLDATRRRALLDDLHAALPGPESIQIDLTTVVEIGRLAS